MGREAAQIPVPADDVDEDAEAEGAQRRHHRFRRRTSQPGRTRRTARDQHDIQPGAAVNAAGQAARPFRIRIQTGFCCKPGPGKLGYGNPGFGGRAEIMRRIQWPALSMVGQVHGRRTAGFSLPPGRSSKEIGNQ